MARRRKRKSRGLGAIVEFRTSRGRSVRFGTGRNRKRSGKGTRGRAKFKAASAACRRKGIKPFTKAFGACMRSWYKKH